MAISKVTVLIIENQYPINVLAFNKLLLKMPQRIQQDVLKYHRWQDRQATLLGKWLLIKGLEILNKNPNAIHSLQKDNYKRPFLADLKMELDFNISHSQGIVVCALSENKIGIDVEIIETIIPSEYKSVFTIQEFRNIEEDQDVMATFFKYWTRKEAIMKADGRGFYLPPASFEAIKDAVKVNEKSWFIQPVSISELTNDSYSCHIATNPKAIIQTYFFDWKEI